MTTISEGISVTEGTRIRVTDALGRSFEKRALSAVEQNGAYPVVWACSLDEWDSAVREERDPEPDPFPWPLDSVSFGGAT